MMLVKFRKSGITSNTSTGLDKGKKVEHVLWNPQEGAKEQGHNTRKRQLCNLGVKSSRAETGI